MKKIFKILGLVIIVSCLTACDETVEEVIYNGSEADNDTFLSFTSSVFNLAVPIDASASIDITLNSSTKSSSDRTFNINLNAEETSADALTYTVPGSVTIPADSYQATITILGQDNGLVEPTAKQIVFSLGDVPDGVFMDENKVIVNIFEVCPIPNDYLVGNYFIEDVIAVVGPGNGTENFAAGIVNITANSETSRTFVAGILPAFAGDRSVVLNLVCNTLILDVVNPNLTCDGVNSYIFSSAGTNNSSYDVNDDSVLTVNYTEDPDGSCGGPFNSSFRLTKQ